MRLIDVDAFKTEHRMADMCGDCERTKRELDCNVCDCCDWLDNAPTVNQWISVEERLPDAAGYECLVCAVNENYNQTHVFTAHTGYGEPGWWTGNVHYMSRVTSPSDNRLHPALNVTHWMPLPTPPEVNRDED